MSISMYQASVPPLTRGLANLSGILDKAAGFAEGRKIEPEALMSARLAPDMFPLARQVQIASDTAKGCVARLAGREPPSYPDVERSFPELMVRLRRTIDFIADIPRAEIDGSEAREIVLPLRSGTLTFRGMDYLLDFVLPNFYFHVTAAYAILRHNGLDIGKRDYLGQR